jgi:hypothetical protein
MRRRNLSADKVDDAIRLYTSGLSLARVGEHLRADPTTVLNRLRERGVTTRVAQVSPPNLKVTTDESVGGYSLARRGSWE